MNKNYQTEKSLSLPTLVAICFLFHLSPSHSQVINLFNVNDFAGAFTEFYGGDTVIDARDTWNGAFNLGVTGITTGSSGLPNPGLGSSASGSFSSDHNLNTLNWDLNGSAIGTLNAGQGNLGSSFPTILQGAGIGASLSFFIDAPFTINLTSSIVSQYSGLALGGSSGPGGASVALFAQVIDGQLFNQYLAKWDTDNGSTGGTYTGSFNQAVFRLEFGAGADLSSNIPDAFGTQYSSYDLQMSVQPIPEPSGMLLIGVGTAFLELRRRRRATEN